MLEPRHGHQFSINSDRKKEIHDKINNIINITNPKPKFRQILTTQESSYNRRTQQLDDEELDGV